MAEPAIIDVVAAVIRTDGRYLLGRRPEGKRHGGLWEFPGGKMLSGESYLDAARRELDEELGLQATAAGALLFSSGDPGSPYVIHFVEVSTAGEAHPVEHTEVGWFDLTELTGMPLAPSDAAFVAWLVGRPPA